MSTAPQADNPRASSDPENPASHRFWIVVAASIIGLLLVSAVLVLIAATRG